MTVKSVTQWIGTPTSLVIHTVVFIGIFVLLLFGIPLDKVMLILTTAVSLEAIYLSIFIQMAVNSQGIELQQVKNNVAEVQETMEEVQDTMEEVQDIVDEQSGQDEIEQQPHKAVDVHRNTQRGS